MRSREHHKLIHPASISPLNLLNFVHMPWFAAEWSRLGLDDEDLRFLEISIMVHPEHGDVIRGADGLRKGRFSPPGSGRGKRGAFRYFYA